MIFWSFLFAFGYHKTFLYRPTLKANQSYDIQPVQNLHIFTHFTTIVLLLATTFCTSDALPLVKFNRWTSDDIIRRGYYPHQTFPYKASDPPYQTYHPYPIIDPFHNYYALPLHKNIDRLQQKMGRVEPIQRSILSNNEVIKVTNNQIIFIWISKSLSVIWISW